MLHAFSVDRRETQRAQAAVPLHERAVERTLQTIARAVDNVPRAHGIMTSAPRFTEVPATVLVVEDHEDSRELLVMLLADAGYRIAAASSAHEALEHLRAGGITFLVTDYNLEGGQTGGWLLETAADLGLLDDVGVVLYSALPTVNAPARLSRVIVYRKPLDTDALLADIARAVARPSHRGLRVLPPISA